MLASIVELISQATSNFHFIFCFCNIIIVFLLTDRSKSDINHTPSSIDTFQLVLNPNTLRNDYENGVKEVEDDYTTEESISEAPTEAAKQVDDTREVHEEEEAACEEDTHQEVHEEENREQESCVEVADDHELNVRIEDFINKIHQEWRAERLRVSKQLKFSERVKF